MHGTYGRDDFVAGRYMLRCQDLALLVGVQAA
jgi:hypothetical protein